MHPVTPGVLCSVHGRGLHRSIYKKRAFAYNDIESWTSYTGSFMSPAIFLTLGTSEVINVEHI